MINPQDFTKLLLASGFDFFTGVPDSTMKEWLADLAGKENHILAANECEALATASGYYLGSGKTACVYMQNSGLGKAVNPLTSLCDKEVYGIPALLIIGWRGEPGKPDEPQHKKMGKIMLPLLDVLGVPYEILPDSAEEAAKAIAKAKMYADNEISPYALIIKENTFSKKSKSAPENGGFAREEAINILLENLSGDEIIVSTTGKTSRELFECREKRGEGHEKDFLTVGSMGCSSSIALGIARAQKEKSVAIFDGDGAALMELGALATVGHYGPKNLLHIIFDNGSYESTGGQATISESVDFGGIAKSCGYKDILNASDAVELKDCLKKIIKKDGPNLLIVKVKSWSRPDLGRPTRTPAENKKDFTENLWKS